MARTRSQNYVRINSRPLDWTSGGNAKPYVYTPPPSAWQLSPADLAAQRARLRRIVSRFWITISPVQRVHHCPACHARGFSFGTCPDCKYVPEGFAAWGQNGHQQWTGPDRAALLHYLKLRATDCRTATRDPYPGAVIGTGFKRGGMVTYLGCPLAE